MTEENPFADPKEVNPFADPSVASHTRSNYSGGLDTYNPFDNQPPPRYDQPPVITPTTVAPVQSEPTTFQSQPFQESAYKASPDPAYVKQQAELNKKAADLEKREQQLRQREVQGRVNNFPPLPKFFPLKPCFFHDISLEIPIESQKTCKILFYMWQLYVFTLFFNFITCLSMFCVGADNGGANFGVSLVYLAVFPCLSYVVWYSRIYNALKKDSSFNYMCFFFVTFFKIIFLIIYSLGAFVFGTVGWINAASEIKRAEGSKVVAIMGFVCATLWTLLAAFNFLMLKRVHSAYRRSGASLEKAQGEFTHAVATNKTVQNAAVSSVKAGVSSQVGGGTQY